MSPGSIPLGLGPALLWTLLPLHIRRDCQGFDFEPHKEQKLQLSLRSQETIMLLETAHSTK